MGKGRYKLLSCMRVVLLDEDWIEINGMQYFGRMTGSRLSSKIVNVFNKINLLKNHKSRVNFYQAMYIANNDNRERDVKLFSFDKRKILTICASKEDYDKQVLIFNKLSKSHNMPSIFSIDEYPNAYEMPMIDLEERPMAGAVLHEISHATALRADNAQKNSVKMVIEAEYDSVEINEILKKLAAYIDSTLLQWDIPLSTQHGDLSMDNLLYGEADGRHGFWWIDWEHIGDRIFFYDYFFYILNAAKCSNHLEALESYFSGDSDDGVKHMFNAFGCVFDEKYRLGYFLVASICILKERVCCLGHLETLKEYYEFIKINVIQTLEGKA